jgi:DHA2 family multidrug resistance protein
MLTIVLNGVPPQRVPAASGLLNFARITAGSFAASITTTVWDRREALHQTRLAESSSVYDPALTNALSSLQAQGLTLAQATGALARSLVNQAYVLASLDFFWVSAWLCLALVPLIWLCKRAIAGGAVAAGD